MEVMRRYKQTEVGVIPENWEVVLLDSVATRGSGHTPDKAHPEYWGGEIKWISLQDTGRLDRLFIDDTAVKITSAGISNSSARMHPMGTVVLSRDAGVGKSAIMNCDMAVSQHFMAWTCGTRLSNKFLYYWLQSSKLEFERIAMGNTIKTIGLPYFKKLVIPLPTKAEQEAIAGALSDADAWIESLEQLIAKKRQIKQGAMQELLTGKRRLPGFSAKWETKRLGDHCHFLRNGTNSRAELTVEGSLKYLLYGDIHSCNSVYICPKSLPSLPKAKAFTLDRLQDGDLILADASEDTIGISKSVEIVGTDGVELVAGLHTIAIRFTEGIFAPRFAGYLQHCPDFNSHLRKLAAGTKVYATNRRHVSSAEVCIPPQKEQTAIATVLADMDAEIESLESKLAKAHEIKQGMMQELLTGRIRLVN